MQEQQIWPKRNSNKHPKFVPGKAQNGQNLGGRTGSRGKKNTKGQNAQIDLGGGAGKPDKKQPEVAEEQTLKPYTTSRIHPKP